MNLQTQPALDEMYSAFMDGDAEYEGVFFVAVKTTGIFCRPTCRARKPLRKNVSFYSRAAHALAAGYRPCKRCRPMEIAGCMPQWVEQIVSLTEDRSVSRWTDHDIRELGIDPTRVRRWFKNNHGITFQAFLRARRLATALAQLSIGEDSTQVALAAGYESLSGFRDAFQKWFGTTPGRINQGGPVLRVNRIPSPLGPLVAAADEKSLFLLEFADRRMLETQFKRLSKRLNCRFSPGDNRIIEQAHNEVSQFFDGNREKFSVRYELPGTAFQQRVWHRLLEIPFGSTSTYEELASQIGSPRACRAVGRANGDNRLAIIVPCHRVVGSDGTLCGYGGGQRRKEWLLNHEKSAAS